MSRVKGKYIATVTIDWDREREPNMLPLQDIKDNFRYFTMSLTEVIQEALDDCSEIKIFEQYRDFYEVEDV